MALIQELAREQSSGHSFVLAVDEPEAHLHPASVHELQSLFNQLSVSQQVVLATHNPIFVNRDRIESNVLVKANTATVAKNVSVLRSALGVQLGDNLQSAETIVLVEGVSDEKILPLLLGQVDSRIETEVSAGRIVFRATKGTGQMRSQIQREKATVCRILCVLDDDAAGKTEAKSIKSHNILPDKNIFLLGNGSRQAEIEDLLLPEVYLASLEQEFGRTFKTVHFANKGRIWTNNLSEAAKTLGIIDSDEDLVDRAKTAVASAVEQAQTVLLRSEKKEHVQALASLILGN